MASLAYFKRTLPAPTATVDGFVCVLNEDWFLQANADALDGATFANGGGNLIVYEDAALTSRLSVDVMSFVTGASPSVEVWVRLPSYSAAKDVYISADDTQTTQPLPSNTYGQYATYQDDVYVTHDGLTDRTGNSTIAQNGAPASGISPWGGDSVALNGSSQYGRASVSLAATRPLTYSAWAKASNVSATQGIFGAYISSEAFTLDAIRTRLSLFRFWTRNAGNTEVVSTQAPTGQWQRITGKAVSNTERQINVDGVVNTDNTNNGNIDHTFNRISYGRLDDSSPSNYFNGELAGMRVTTRVLSDSFLALERLNQVDPANFGTSSDWTTPSSDVTAVGTITLPPLQISGSATDGSPDVTAVGTITLPPLQISGSATDGSPDVTAVGTITLPPLIVSGTDKTVKTSYTITTDSSVKTIQTTSNMFTIRL